MNRSHRRHEAILRIVDGARAASLPPLTRHPIAQFMTPTPHSVGRDQTLETAHGLMRKYGIRHLPVLDGGKLTGILSQRDLYFVESLAGADPHTVFVEEAMSPDTYSVPPETPVEEVAADMAEHGYGCAVVMAGGKVAGVFTTTDALRALSRLLARTTAEPS